MEKIKISVVSYLNSKPFIFGLQNSTLIDSIDLQLDIPSVCAQKLVNGDVDIGLIPVAVIPKLKEHYIISDYCIGAEGKVASVILYSNVPLSEIKTVLLDYQSQTSVTLVKVLAKYFWKIHPDWENTGTDFEQTISGTTAAVIIGDRTFGLENQYNYEFDLAEEWQKFTKLPFVFACWVANKKMDDLFIEAFNNSLQTGLENRHALIEKLKENNFYKTDLENYLFQKIKYNFDAEKKKALKLFLEYCTQL